MFHNTFAGTCKIMTMSRTVFDNNAIIYRNNVHFEVNKIANNTAPIYLTDLFQMRGNDGHLNNSQLNIRSTSNKNFLIPKPKISLFKNSLSYSGALVWNSVPLWIKISSTIESFTINCLQWMKCDCAS